MFLSKRVHLNFKGSILSGQKILERGIKNNGSSTESNESADEPLVNGEEKSPYGFASSTRLKRVCVARLKRLNPP
jgi:hypothetical protein